MASRRISEKTTKIVWARAGGMCSYPDCHKPLIVSPENSADPLAVLGEIAHIVGYSEDGPRGEKLFRGADRDSPENLLLLCTEHHTLIDQQPESHPTSWLYWFKEDHERWVCERLSLDQRFFALAGHIANEKVREGVLERYRERKTEQTLRRQRADIALFERYLEDVKAPLKHMADDLEQWQYITFGLVEGFQRWQLEKGYSIGSVMCRIARSQMRV